MDLVSQYTVDRLVESRFAGVSSKMDAVAVVHHCDMHELSLFDFAAMFRVEDGILVSRDVSTVHDPSEIIPTWDDPAESESDYKYGGWRNQSLAADRLESLRKHVAEVRIDGPSEYLSRLLDLEHKLARVVEPVPTLGMVADDLDSPAGHDEYPESESADPMADTTELPVIVPPSIDEKAAIADVLANPKSARSTKEPPRVDNAGRVLVDGATLADLYSNAARIGFSEVAVQELVLKKFGLREITDLPAKTALEVIGKMKARAADGSAV